MSRRGARPKIQYPKHPDNNVRYHYGKQEEDKARRGRLWLVEDASGGVEYFYGDMGEVEKEIRTIRISPSEVQTYVTEYEYDSWNRIQKMVYPDGERLYFGYNIAGNLTNLTGYKSPKGTGSISNTPPFGGEGAGIYSYIAQQGYDEFEQKVYRRLGNGTETTYTYEPVMRRLAELKAMRPPYPQGNNGGLMFQNNQYAYDLVGNILSVENAVSLPSTLNQLGGSSKYAYEYDELNRLIKAKGQFEGTSNKADYELNMQYNRLNGIVQKALNYTLNGQDKGYTLDYKYDNPNHPHAPSSISGISGAGKPRNYQYDGNGNPISYDEFKGFRSMVWDEENRLRGINDNGRLHLYTYDHTGERALKSSAESSMAVINGLASAVITHTEDYTAYVSPYFVVNKGKFTKHYFEGSSRVVSKLGEGTFSHKNTGIMAGGIDYLKRTQKEQEARDSYIKGLQVPPGPPTQHGIYTTPEWTGEAYPSVDWQSISQNQEPPAGWPRPPKFNEPGDVPGPPVQYGEAITNANVKAGYGFIPNGVEERNLYYYHPDHLGSSSYITDKNGEIIQHTEYIAFGEILVDEHSTSNKMPYLFNGKELDFEIGLYYYGARYYDPKVSIFLNVDPLVEKTGTPYAYTYNNPIRFIDPTGMESEGWGLKDNKWEWQSDLTKDNYKERGFEDYREDGSIIENVSIVGKENENTGYTYLGYSGNVSYTNAPQATISQWDGDRGFFGNWANSDNILGKLSYSIANNFYLAAQVIDFDLLGKDYINPLTGSRAFTNLDDTPQYNVGERAIAFSSVFNPISPKFVPKSSIRVSNDVLTPLTAPQFSKMFKGTFIAREKPVIRGYINRGINFIIDKINNVNTLKSGITGTIKKVKDKEEK